MSCNKAWNIDFMVASFTKSFINNTLKEHREHQLYEREIAMLPATQPIVERALNVKHHEDIRKDLSAQLSELKKQQFKIQSCINDQNDAIGQLYNQKPETEKRPFMRHCPFDNCRGFLNTQYKCGICNNFTCPECHELKGLVKDIEHVCNPENVATAKLLAKDTKHCPNCAIPIHKIIGCNQMFCTGCNTAFDWVTMRIVTGVIHNPHYFELQRKLGVGNVRPIGDVPCGGLPEIRQLDAALKIINPKLNTSNVGGTSLVTLTQWLTHMHEYERRRYIVNNITDNVDLRVKFMMHELTPEAFKKTLQQREKARSKKIEIEQVIAMTYTVAGDILRGILRAFDEEEVTERMDELERLVVYAQISMGEIANKYTCSVPSMVYIFNTLAVSNKKARNESSIMIF
jgi:hypothetical protein